MIGPDMLHLPGNAEAVRCSFQIKVKLFPGKCAILSSVALLRSEIWCGLKRVFKCCISDRVLLLGHVSAAEQAELAPHLCPCWETVTQSCLSDVSWERVGRCTMSDRQATHRSATQQTVAWYQRPCGMNDRHGKHQKPVPGQQSHKSNLALSRL